MPNRKFELRKDGTVGTVSPFGSHRPTVEASTKTEATAKFLAFAYRAVQNTPRVKVRSGAYQLAYESLSYGINVEAGVEGRQHALCFSGVAAWDDLKDDCAGFDYYASPTYTNS